MFGSSKIPMLKPTPQGDSIRRTAFGGDELMGMEPCVWDHVLIKELPCLFHCARIQLDIGEPGEGSCPTVWHPDHGLTVSRTVRRKSLWLTSPPACAVLLQQPKWMEASPFPASPHPHLRASGRPGRVLRSQGAECDSEQSNPALFLLQMLEMRSGIIQGGPEGVTSHAASASEEPSAEPFR